MFEFLKQANKSTWGVFFYLGVIFIVAAVTGGFALKSEYTVIKETFIPFVFALGVVLLLFCMFREWQTNKPAAVMAKAPNVSAYKVAVTSPEFNAHVTPNDRGVIVFEGTAKKDPKADGLQLLYMTTGHSGFWPQLLPFDETKKTWKFEYTPGTFANNDRRFFTIYAVGKNGQALVHAYRNINNVLKKTDRGYEPLYLLTDDFYLCVEHAVILTKPLDGAARSSGAATSAT